jgi:hypothetical protein
VTHNLAVRRPSPWAPAAAAAACAALLAVSIARGLSLSADLASARADLESARFRAGVMRAAAARADALAAPHLLARAARDALAARSVDPGILRRIEPALPGDCWLVSADLRGGRLVLSGRSLSWRSAAAFADALQRVPGIARAWVSTLSSRGASREYDFLAVAELRAPGAGGPAP